MVMSWRLLEMTLTPEHGEECGLFPNSSQFKLNRKKAGLPHRSLSVPGKVTTQLLDLAKHLQKGSKFIGAARRSFLVCENRVREEKMG